MTERGNKGYKSNNSGGDLKLSYRFGILVVVAKENPTRLLFFELRIGLKTDSATMF
jgi:hypothetical protein